MAVFSLQHRVASWVKECMGFDLALDVREREYRFLEEALELVQATGLPREDALKMVSEVYDRPYGDRDQELGGVMVTLLASAEAIGRDAEIACEVELHRCYLNIEKIREKQKSKLLRSKS